MELPNFSHPTFTLTLPSTKQTITFRPFLVKEEKILLVAQASGEQSDIVRAIKNVVASCIVTEGVDVDDFTTFDLEYFFIKLRAKSVQNIIKLSYKDNEDDQIYDVEVDLDQVEIAGEEDVNKKITIDANSGLVLRYPKISIMNDVEHIDNPVDFNFAIMEACIEKVYTGDSVVKLSDFSRQEIATFIDTLDVRTYQAIQQFVEKMPRVEHTVSYVNSTGREVKIVLKSLTDFFTLG